ncbi:MAG: YdcF family protein [Sphingomonadales bacterium]|nr:YdcF family protein [Sphingomonadales bacterium]MDE2171868.1 YdcF family protein [Sphingomonadales bacterium]
MIRRLVSLVLLVWALGFIAFAVFLPRPAGNIHADGVIVLTGSDGRIQRGLETLHKGLARRMLVSGVDGEVTQGQFAALYHVDTATMRCCIDLGYDSVDTRSNATESSAWIADHHYTSVRLVTSDWHMRRAAFELARTVPHGVTVIEDAVPTRPSLSVLFTEYCKWLARRAWLIWRQS